MSFVLFTSNAWLDAWKYFIDHLPSIITAVITAYGIKKVTETGRTATETKGAVSDLHKAVNGKLDDLVTTTAKAARAEGIAEGKALAADVITKVVANPEVAKDVKLNNAG